MKRAYTVTGIWPFPLDMLRHDEARAASEADQILIDRMSGEFSDDKIGCLKDVTINLVMEAGEATRARPNGRYLPNDKRWESFGWTVSGVPEIEQSRAFEQAERADADLRRSGLAKLTPEERRVFGLE